MVSPALPASIVQQLQAGAAVIVVAPGAAAAWAERLAAVRAELVALGVGLVELPGIDSLDDAIDLEAEMQGYEAELAADPESVTALERLAAVAPSHRVLHRLLEVFTAQRKWPRALDALARLVDQEPVAARRARFRYAAAAIARDELGDATLAAAELGAALDDDPHSPGAFDALIELGDPAQQIRAFRRQLTRLGDGAPDVILDLWLRLAALCQGPGGDRATAIAAYQVACELAPDEPAHAERLAELYLEAGAPHRRDAIAQVEALIARAPERIELYQVLSELYGDAGDADAAWCVAQVLVLLGAATDDEARRFARGRPQGAAAVARRLTDELWQAIAHPAEDPQIGAALERASAAAARGHAQPLAAFGLDPAARVDLSGDVARDPRPASRLLHQVVRGLAIAPAPSVWYVAGDGLRLASTRDAGPALVIGERALARLAPRELAFAAGKQLAYLRPERIAAFAVPTLPQLEAAYVATAGAGAGGVAAWRAATDLTANRAGLVICDDLDAAVRAIATEGTTLSGLSAKDRIRDLLGFAVSARYFAVRRHLGQSDAVARAGAA